MITSASCGKRTHVYRLEGYRATTSSMMLVSLNSDGRKHYVLKPFWSMVYWKGSNPVCYFASFGNRTHVNSSEGCYVTTTPMMLLNSVMEEGQQTGCFFFCNKYQRKISVNVIASASYKHRTHINSLEGYYATTTPTMPVYDDKEKGEQQGCELFCNKYHLKFSINVIASASYGNRTHIYSLEGYYATTTPTMLLNYVMEK